MCLVQTAADAPRPRVPVKKEWDTTPTWHFQASDGGQSTGSSGGANMWNTWSSWLAGFTFWGTTLPGDTNNAGRQSTGFASWRLAGVGIWEAWVAGDRTNAAGALLRSGMILTMYVGCEVGYMYMYDTLTVFWMDLIGYTQHMPQENQTDSGDAAALAESQAALALAEDRASLAEGRAALAEGQAALALAEDRASLAEGRAALAEGQAALALAEGRAAQQGGTEKEALATKEAPAPQPVPTPTAQDAEYGRNNYAMYLYNLTETEEKKTPPGSCKRIWTCVGQTPPQQPVLPALVSGVQTHQKPLTRQKNAETNANGRASADDNAPAQDDGWLQQLAIGAAVLGGFLLVAVVHARNTAGVTVNQTQYNNGPNTNEVVVPETTRQPVTPVGEDEPRFTLEQMQKISKDSGIEAYERAFLDRRIQESVGATHTEK